MPSATTPLPSDPQALRAFAVSLQEALATKDRELAARDAELHAKTLHIEKLRAMIALMKRARFGHSSEKIDQLELLIGDLEEAAAEEQAREASAQTAEDRPVAKAGAPRPRGRQPLPAHLPRERVVHPPAPACPACGGTCLTRLGEDEREVLEYVPSHFKVVVHVRPRMSCRACETITQVPAPALPIERGRPGPGLLAHVLVAKYCDHQPLHRQAVIYGRAGVELERSTLADWVGQAAFLLEPLAAAITRHVRAGAALHADDTPVPVLDPGRGRTKTGRLWVVVRDERPWGGPAPPAVSYL
jgi:transposase